MEESHIKTNTTSSAHTKTSSILKNANSNTDGNTTNLISSSQKPNLKKKKKIWLINVTISDSKNCNIFIKYTKDNNNIIEISGYPISFAYGPFSISTVKIEPTDTYECVNDIPSTLLHLPDKKQYFHDIRNVDRNFNDLLLHESWTYKNESTIREMVKIPLNNFNIFKILDTELPSQMYTASIKHKTSKIDNPSDMDIEPNNNQSNDPLIVSTTSTIDTMKQNPNDIDSMSTLNQLNSTTANNMNDILNIFIDEPTKGFNDKNENDCIIISSDEDDHTNIISVLKCKIENDQDIELKENATELNNNETSRDDVSKNVDGSLNESKDSSDIVDCTNPSVRPIHDIQPNINKVNENNEKPVNSLLTKDKENEINFNSNCSINQSAQIGQQSDEIAVKNDDKSNTNIKENVEETIVIEAEIQGIKTASNNVKTIETKEGNDLEKESTTDLKDKGTSSDEENHEMKTNENVECNQNQSSDTLDDRKCDNREDGEIHSSEASADEPNKDGNASSISIESYTQPRLFSINHLFDKRKSNEESVVEEDIMISTWSINPMKKQQEISLCKSINDNTSSSSEERIFDKKRKIVRRHSRRTRSKFRSDLHAIQTSEVSEREISKSNKNNSTNNNHSNEAELIRINSVNATGLKLKYLNDALTDEQIQSMAKFGVETLDQINYLTVAQLNKFGLNILQIHEIQKRVSGEVCLNETHTEIISNNNEDVDMRLLAPVNVELTASNSNTSVECSIDKQVDNMETQTNEIATDQYAEQPNNSEAIQHCPPAEEGELTNEATDNEIIKSNSIVAEITKPNPIELNKPKLSFSSLHQIDVPPNRAFYCAYQDNSETKCRKECDNETIVGHSNMHELSNTKGKKSNNTDTNQSESMDFEHKFNDFGIYTVVDDDNAIKLDIPVKDFQSEIRDLCLPFTPVQTNFIPATEIDASITSNAPIKYKLTRIDVEKTDYTEMIKTFSSKNEIVDPRIRQILCIGPIIAKRPLIEEPPHGGFCAETNKSIDQKSVDPRYRTKHKIRAVDLFDATTTFNIQCMLQNSLWYRDLGSNQKIDVNQQLTLLSIELKNFNEDPSPTKIFDSTFFRRNALLQELFKDLKIDIDMNGKFVKVANNVNREQQFPVFTNGGGGGGVAGLNNGLLGIDSFDSLSRNIYNNAAIPSVFGSVPTAAPFLFNVFGNPAIIPGDQIRNFPQFANQINPNIYIAPNMFNTPNLNAFQINNNNTETWNSIRNTNPAANDMKRTNDSAPEMWNTIRNTNPAVNDAKRTNDGTPEMWKNTRNKHQKSNESWDECPRNYVRNVSIDRTNRNNNSWKKTKMNNNSWNNSKPNKSNAWSDDSQDQFKNDWNESKKDTNLQQNSGDCGDNSQDNYDDWNNPKKATNNNNNNSRDMNNMNSNKATDDIADEFWNNDIPSSSRQGPKIVKQPIVDCEENWDDD